MSHLTRKSTGAAALALALLAGGAGSAQADIARKLEYTCKYPLVDKQPLTIDLTSNIPATAQLNELQPAFKINAVATAKGNTSQAITTLNAQAIDGTSQAKASLHFPSGFVQEDLLVGLTVNTWNRPAGPVPNPLVLTASGETPAVVLDERGQTKVVLDSISLNLRALKADGSPINVKKLTSDFDGNPVPVDTTPEDFNVYCKLNAGESNVIATIDVLDGPCSPGCGGEPPSVPTEGVYGPGDIGEDFVVLRWGASTAAPGGPGLRGYVIEFEDQRYEVPAGTTSKRFEGLEPGSDYVFSIRAVSNTGVESAGHDQYLLTLPRSGPADVTPPSKPGAGIYTGDDSQQCSATRALWWQPSTDEPGGSGLKGYVVTHRGKTYEVAAPDNVVTVTDAVPAGPLVFSVVAVDKAGNRSEPLEVNAPTPPNSCIPNVPGGLSAGTVTPTSVALAWYPPIVAGFGPPVVGYAVYVDGVKVATVPPTGEGPRPNTYTVTGLKPKTAYAFAVEAVGEVTSSPKTPPLTVTTGDEPASTCPSGLSCLDYDLKGSTSLKTITRGTLPLLGGLKARTDLATGNVTGDLVLNRTSGRLVIADWLPITAQLVFVPVGKTTGKLTPATATTPAGIELSTKVRIKVGGIKTFGAIPLAGGNNCQTKQVSDITVKSTNAFDPLTGGTVAGTYKISDLNGCGPFNGLISPLTAGDGNTITLDLTKKG